MAVIPSKAADFLAPEQARELGRKSNLAGTLLVVHAWALIAVGMALFAWWLDPLTLLVGVMVIGGRQLGLATLMQGNEMELQSSYRAVLRKAISRVANAAGDLQSRQTTQHI